MKKRQLFALAAAVAVASGVMAETRLYVYKNDGTSVSFNVSDLDSLSFAAPERLSLVSADSENVSAEGGSFTVQVSSDTRWTVSSTQDWCTPAVTEGEGDGSFAVTVAANAAGTSDEATVTVTSLSGLLSCVVKVYRDASSALSVTDCQGHIYPVVQIGEQYWMAENLQCTQYDTESERAGATLTASSTWTDNPYYTDDRNATNGSAASYSENLTDELRAKLGLLYNWAAVMGYASSKESYAQSGAYSGNRQGICPNGWHVPSQAEWKTLNNYVASQNSAVSVDTQLRSTSGWYTGGNGTDAYGFNLLPAGYDEGEGNNYIGNAAFVWSSKADDSVSGLGWYTLPEEGAILDEFSGMKYWATSVRCVKN